jgi:hypothetical protein
VKLSYALLNSEHLLLFQNSMHLAELVPEVELSILVSLMKLEAEVVWQQND